MIVADTSAIVAIVFAEPERDVFVRVILRAQRVLVSTVSVVEARMVVHGRRGQRAVVLVDDLLRLPMFEAIPPGAVEMDAAYAAFLAFGEGSGHSAALYFGDVFSTRWPRSAECRCSYFSETDIASRISSPASSLRSTRYRSAKAS